MIHRKPMTVVNDTDLVFPAGGVFEAELHVRVADEIEMVSEVVYMSCISSQMYHHKQLNILFLSIRLEMLARTHGKDPNRHQDEDSGHHHGGRYPPWPSSQCWC